MKSFIFNRDILDIPVRILHGKGSILIFLIRLEFMQQDFSKEMNNILHEKLYI